MLAWKGLSNSLTFIALDNKSVKTGPMGILKSIFQYNTHNPLQPNTGSVNRRCNKRGGLSDWGDVWSQTSCVFLCVHRSQASHCSCRKVEVELCYGCSSSINPDWHLQVQSTAVHLCWELCLTLIPSRTLQLQCCITALWAITVGQTLPDCAVSSN